jgi:hypothetical protein
MYISEFCEVYWEKELNAVICKWKKSCSHNDYRDPLEYGLGILLEHGCRYWITDTAGGFINNEDDDQWLAEVFIPKAAVSSCIQIYFIVSQLSELKCEIEKQGSVLKQYFRISYCDDMEIVSAEIDKTDKNIK